MKHSYYTMTPDHHFFCHFGATYCNISFGVSRDCVRVGCVRFRVPVVWDVLISLLKFVDVTQRGRG